MKKFALLLSLALSVLAFAFTGCSDDKFTEKSYSSGETEIKKITVQVEDRELEISASEDNRISIDYFDGEKEYLDITVEGKELRVNLAIDKSWTDYIGVKPSKSYRIIKIRVPDNLIKVFSASTTNESIKLNPLTFKDRVELKSGGGSIFCERVSVGYAIRLAAKNGDIKGSVIGGWDDFAMYCQIKNGKCNLPTEKVDGEKSFFADCNNGDINIDFVV